MPMQVIEKYLVLLSILIYIYYIYYIYIFLFLATQINSLPAATLCIICKFSVIVELMS